MQDRLPITKRQKEILNFVVQTVAKKGYTPSLQEIADHFKMHIGTAQYFTDKLIKMGYLKRRANVSRGLTPTTEPTTIPLLGIIAAGAPIEPIENPEEIMVPPTIDIDPKYPHYALKIAGDSMQDMGIMNNDIVLIRHQLTAQDRDTVVAVTEKGATLKVYRTSGGPIRLEPRNKDYKTIYPKELEIRGKFIGLIRSEQ